MLGFTKNELLDGLQQDKYWTNLELIIWYKSEQITYVIINLSSL